jgi:hypothetical protein
MAICDKFYQRSLKFMGNIMSYSTRLSSFILSLCLSTSVLASSPLIRQANNQAGSLKHHFNQRDLPAIIDLALLTPAQGCTIQGAAVSERSGWSVSSAGDMNGDGLDDLIVGAPFASPNSRSRAGASYVVYGQGGGLDATLDLNSPPEGTVTVIQGAANDDWSGWSVSSAGDVNGDGIDDLIIGAPFADPNSRRGAGASYVVYGQAGGLGATLDLNSPPAGNVTVIQGAAAFDGSGWSVSDAGDVNGDGIDDLIIGAPFAALNTQLQSGVSYVVYGQAGGLGATLDLNSPAAGTVTVIQGGSTADQSGRSVSSAGDVNGDGIDDLIIGAPYASPDTLKRAGVSYVVYGQAGGLGTTLDLNSPAAGTVTVIQAATAKAHAGYSVSSAGDVNGDGIDDLIVGAPFADPNILKNAGASYVVYGQAGGLGATLDLNSPPAGTVTVIQGAIAKAQAGYSVSSAGDVNGDGIDDLIVGAPYASPDTLPQAGVSYVVYGQAGGLGTTLDLNSSFAGTLTVIQGAGADFDRSGYSVSNAGDVNGDGIDDLIVGAPYASPDTRPQSGASYVVYGIPDPLTSVSPSQFEKATPPEDKGTNGHYIDSSAAATLSSPWSVISNWFSAIPSRLLPLQKPFTRHAVESDNPQFIQLKTLKVQCQKLIDTAPEAANKWYTFSLEDLIEEMDEALAEPHAIDKETLEYFKAGRDEIKEDFLSPEALSTAAMPRYKHKGLIDLQDYDLNMLNVSAPVYRLPVHTAPALE